MTNILRTDLQIKRSESTLDLFKRYYNYLSDTIAANSDTARNNYSLAMSNRIRFNKFASFGIDEVEEKFDKLPNVPDSDGFYENFIWSYGGLRPSGEPRSMTVNQTAYWLNITSNTRQRWVEDPDSAKTQFGIATKDLLALSYKIPSLQHVPDVEGFRSSGYSYDFVTNLKQFVENNTYIPGQNLDTTARPDAQTQDIRNPLNEYLATIETSGDRNRTVVTRFLRELFFNSPGFGDQRQDSDMSYKGVEFSEAKKLIYKDQLTGEVGFEKFVRLLTEAPIQSVTPRDDLPSNLSLDLNRDGVIDYEVVDFSRAELLVVEGSSLYAVDERPPIRRAQPYPRSGNLSFTIGPLQNLQNLSEVVYALLGSSGEGTEHPLWINYNMFKEQIRRAFGTISPSRVYDAIRVVNVDELQEFDQENLGKQLIATRNTIFAQDLGLSDPFTTVEYYNFRPFMKPIMDYRSYRLFTDSMGLSDSSVITATSDFSTIEPHYNFYLKNYEEAISSDLIPENILPNLYIYSFITDRTSDFDEEPTWDNSAAAQEVQGSFDRLITLDEFEATSLPRINSQDDGFISYLQRYSDAVKNQYQNVQDDSGAVVEFVSELSRENYHITTPASEMNIFERLYGRKSAFPMAIEVGFPMATTQLIGSLIDDTLTSTSFVNSVITSQANLETFDFTCSGYVAEGSDETASREANIINDYLDVERTESEASPKKVRATSDCKIFDFDEWMTNAQNEIEAQVQGQQGRERFRGQCPTLLDAVTFDSIRNTIKSEARRKMTSYEQILKKDETFSESETIIYKLTKYRVQDDNVIDPRPVQNFYFPNSKKMDLVKFVDTQVKFEQKYRYELSGIEVVYGSKFEMRVLDSDLVDPATAYQGNNKDLPLYAVVNVKSLPNPKIVEFPIYGRVWKNTNVIGGLYFPDVWVCDRPPPPPSMMVSPLKDNFQQLLLSFQPSNEVFVGDRAIPWILLNEVEDWEATFLDSIIHQKEFKNYSLESPNCEFASESGAEVQRIQVFRTDEPPIVCPTERDFYRKTFNGKIHKILDISGNPDVPPNEQAIAFDCLDNLEVNKKYYYTARSMDVHGKVSNPSPVYVAEIVFQKGTYYPYIDLYNPTLVKNTISKKKMSRFLEIKAAPIQSGIKYEQDANSDIVSSQRGFIDDSSYKVENNKFLVRLTSRDTGRKIQFNISFKRDKTTEET